MLDSSIARFAEIPSEAGDRGSPIFIVFNPDVMGSARVEVHCHVVCGLRTVEPAVHDLPSVGKEANSVIAGCAQFISARSRGDKFARPPDRETVRMNRTRRRTAAPVKIDLGIDSLKCWPARKIDGIKIFSPEAGSPRPIRHQIPGWDARQPCSPEIAALGVTNACRSGRFVLDPLEYRDDFHSTSAVAAEADDIRGGPDHCDRLYVLAQGEGIVFVFQ